MAEKRKPGFQKGTSGNPAGKPKGARHATTLAIEALLDGEAETITRKAIEAAKEGDAQAIRLCLDRICPPKRERSVSFEMPKLETGADAMAVISAIAHALADGDLTPGEAATSASVIGHFTKAAESVELEARVQRLEAAIAANEKKGG
jgi:hypothetical protein